MQPSGWSRGNTRPRRKRGRRLLLMVVVVGAMAVVGAALVGNPLRLAAQQVCAGRVEVDVRRYSYKPGQQGTDHRFICVEGDAHRDVTDQTINLALAGVAVLVLSAVGLGAAVTLVSRRRRGRGGGGAR